MYNDSLEKWWVPFQCHWNIDDEDWMAERRKIWGTIRGNVAHKKEALGIKGMRNIFLTGYLLSEAPPRPDVDGIVKNMGVNPTERLILAPFTEKSDYKEFAEAVFDFHGDRGLANILNPFYELVHCLKDTGILQNKITNIYMHVLGGGTIYDNSLLFKSDRVTKLFDIPLRMNMYFFYLSELLQLDEKVEKHEYACLDSLFDYFTSMADYLSENEEKYEKAMLRMQNFPSYYEKFKNPCPLRDKESRALYEKSREFVFGGRLPKALRVE